MFLIINGKILPYSYLNVHFKLVRLVFFKYIFFFFPFCLIRFSLFWTVGSGLAIFKLDFFF